MLLPIRELRAKRPTVVDEFDAQTARLLENELAEAQRLAADFRFAAVVSAMGLRTDRASWGFAHVRFEGARYWPAPDGDLAFVIACEHGARLLDLVACRTADRCAATRNGDGHVLGRVWVDRAKVRGERLVVHADPLGWLHRGQVGAVVVDWTAGPQLLAGVGGILAADEFAWRFGFTTRCRASAFSQLSTFAGRRMVETIRFHPAMGLCQPFVLPDDIQIRPRQWLYAPWCVRGHVSLLFGHGRRRQRPSTSPRAWPSRPAATYWASNRPNRQTFGF